MLLWWNHPSFLRVLCHTSNNCNGCVPCAYLFSALCDFYFSISRWWPRAWLVLLIASYTNSAVMQSFGTHSAIQFWLFRAHWTIYFFLHLLSWRWYVVMPSIVAMPEFKSNCSQFKSFKSSPQEWFCFEFFFLLFSFYISDYFLFWLIMNISYGPFGSFKGGVFHETQGDGELWTHM